MCDVVVVRSELAAGIPPQPYLADGGIQPASIPRQRALLRYQLATISSDQSRVQRCAGKLQPQMSATQAAIFAPMTDHIQRCLMARITAAGSATKLEASLFAAEIFAVKHGDETI